MSRIIEGYNYDIFISYRQKDNRGERWVSEFVKKLKTELESTFKEEISVYFDINPHDGLLETHDVDESLKEKLKCLIFIPVISRTYCDPKSFAWEHEFKTFVEQASKDQFGLKVRLPNGNVASRILPVRIHDLDAADIKECELVLGGVLRGVEFIYKESGFNRPLKPDDDEKVNLNKTKYRNQITKVALAIKEIVAGMKGEPMEIAGEPKELISVTEKSATPEKSIIVLPFENISPEPDQEYFSDGLTEEVITDLSYIPDLLVISRNSAMTFKGTKKKTVEIAREVNVRYVLEGSVRKAGINLRITAQLIDGNNDSHIWAEKYTGTLEDIFDIQERVSQSIANALKIKLSSLEKKKIHERPIDNVFAYDCYKKAYIEIQSFIKERVDYGLNLLQKGLDIAGENAVIYAGIALAYWQYVNLGIDHEKNIKKAEEYVEKALNLDHELAEAHIVMGGLSMANGDIAKTINHLSRANTNKPKDTNIMIWLAFFYSVIGRSDKGISLINECIKIDPVNPAYELMTGCNYFFNGKFDLALDPTLSAYEHMPESGMYQLWKALVLLYSYQVDKAYEFICNSVQEPGGDINTQVTIFLKYILQKDRDKIISMLTPDFTRDIRMDFQISYHVATFYSYLGEKEKSLEFLENAVNRGFINYPLIADLDPFLENIRGDERFKKLMERVKYEWENFEA